MATALIVLAIGSIAAGWINIPHALGGHAILTAWLEPAFNATNCGQPVTTGELAGIAIEDCLPGEGGEAADHTSLELTLMAVSSLVAFAGIGLATFLWLKNKQIPERMAQQYSGIHTLSSDIARKLSAGQVIDGIASVVKELLENALDGGATHITCVLRNRGMDEIVVQDNGCGFSAASLMVVGGRHHTSKLATLGMVCVLRICVSATVV